jgi:uncharacterized coiled-coil protein SlyX
MPYGRPGGLIIAVVAILAVGCGSASESDLMVLSERVATLDQRVAELEEATARVSELQTLLDGAETSVAQTQRQLDELRQLLGDSEAALSSFAIDWIFVDNVELALLRVARHVSLLSLELNGQSGLSSGSAQAERCLEWYVKNVGSLADCGFANAGAQ